MLFKQKHLKGIKEGSITLAFRKWKRVSVKQSSIIKTAIGQVEIKSVEKTNIREITLFNAHQAGFTRLDELIELLEAIPEGDIYKVEVAYHSPDPRIALRNQVVLNRKEFEEIKTKLNRLDKYSKVGPWTHDTLLAIQKNPKLKAADLAQLLSREKEWLKLNIRKLKNLGLTISHNPGYEISTFGKAYLQKCKIQ